MLVYTLSVASREVFYEFGYYCSYRGDKFELMFAGLNKFSFEFFFASTASLAVD